MASFMTTRSPVQHFARQKPVPLFTIPEGFRPVLEIEWDVEDWPVLSDGTLDPQNPEPRTFLMRISTDGTVRYIDNELVDGVGYLRYNVQLA